MKIEKKSTEITKWGAADWPSEVCLELVVQKLESEEGGSVARRGL